MRQKHCIYNVYIPEVRVRTAWAVGKWSCSVISLKVEAKINTEGSRLSNLCVDSNRITSNQCVIEKGSRNQNAKKVYFHTIKYDNMCFLHFYCNDKIQIYFQTSSFIKLYSNIAWKSERQQILVTIIRSKDALDQVKNVVRFHLFCFLFFLNSPRNVRLETAAA